MAKSLKDKITQALLESKKISKKELNAAMVVQQERGVRLDQILIEKGLIKEQDLLMLLVRELNIPFINLRKYKIDAGLKDVISERVARQYTIIPLSLLDDTMTIALSDPLNVFIVDDIKNITGKNIDVVMSTATEINAAIDNYYGVQGHATVTEVSKDIKVEDFEIVSGAVNEDDLENAMDESAQVPIIRMVNLIIKEAITQRASDIHLEPKEDSMRVRYRVDGVLQDILKIPKENQNAVIVRIKIMSQLDITVNHTPQDGRFKLKFADKQVDFRVSILPTTFGQKIVLRILDKENLSIGLDGLGISPKPLKILQQGVQKPFGMILVTGPTGSGKSTTLYSLLSELNTADRNIITIEDPVEYLVEGLTQIQARPEIGLTFAEGLRSILRQSPDVVMVGEIRDDETADIAIKAALTGQLVFSTLHTNDAPGALTRLIDMGVEPFLVASSIVLVSAQRLCRKICEKCKKEIKLPKAALGKFAAEIPSGAKFYEGKGCKACRDTGYHGRMCVTEVMDMDDTIRDMLLKGKSSDDLKEYARKEKEMATLWDDALDKCLSGQTTFEEVLRVTSED